MELSLRRLLNIAIPDRLDQRDPTALQHLDAVYRLKRPATIRDDAICSCSSFSVPSLHSTMSSSRIKDGSLEPFRGP